MSEPKLEDIMSKNIIKQINLLMDSTIKTFAKSDIETQKLAFNNIENHLEFIKYNNIIEDYKCTSKIDKNDFNISGHVLIDSEWHLVEPIITSKMVNAGLF